jgi:microcystin degradation protein MlrC
MSQGRQQVGAARRKRVLVAAFAMEANTFAPGTTTLADFQAQMWAVGADIEPDVLGAGSELGAAWRLLAGRGYDVVPSVVAWSAPRQPLAPDALAEIVRLATLPCDDSIDGVYVMLHGSAVAHGDDDPEGTLLAALRACLGSGKPIAISLDCHAHLTPAMVESVDVVTAYRTCPHIDTERTGEEAARLLADALEGRIQPVVAMAARPMITPPELHDNDREPFRSLMARCGELERDGVLATGLLMVQPWIDVPGLSWKAVATADGDREQAMAAAQTLIDEAWAAREGFLPDAGPAIEDALAEALAARTSPLRAGSSHATNDVATPPVMLADSEVPSSEGRPSPVVLADSGDATNGGSVGDSTELLRAALRRAEGARILLSVVAPEAALTAHAAGVGASIEVALGTGAAGDYNERTPLAATVERLFDGEFAYTHPVNAGYRATTGPAALLRAGAIDVVVHTRSVGVIDPTIYEALGADPAAYDVVQAKSHVSHRAGFARISDRTIVAATNGPTTAQLATLDYAKRPRPLFPFERD